MAETDKLEKLASEFEAGMAREKCRKCGCMKGALEEILDSLEAGKDRTPAELKTMVQAWLGKAEESLYT